ncbi:MAG: tol-pal system-associated acyl-CoA thioesterase [Hydrogenophilales bacterium]|nr:tol-pal system-associated acyl-CoA thioesterase [Hydrogenophilales bacterium]
MSLGLEPETFSFPVRVYYEDTDSGGVVYYANYLKFLERARTEWLRAAGFEQPELLRDHNVIFVVRSVTIEYLRPAQFNDELAVTVRMKKLGRSTIEVFQTVEREARLIEASVKIVCVDGASFKPVSIPAPIKQQLESLAPA